MFSKEIVVALVLFWAACQGEYYFPDVMDISEMKCSGNWFFLAYQLGNALTILIPSASGDYKPISWWHPLIPAMCDFVSMAAILGGVAMATAQTRSILGNSTVVWSAFLSKQMLKRSMSWHQWAGIMLLVAGLVVKINFQGFKAGDKGSFRMLVGSCMILVGCAGHSFSCVVNEYFIKRFKIQPTILCSRMGVVSLVVWFLLYIAGYILPEDHTRIWTRADFSVATLWDRHPDAPMNNAIALFFFFLCSWMHSFVFYIVLLGKIGVVSCGVMKGLNTSTYVIFSHFLFGALDEKYCVDYRKIWASILCVSGVFVYGLGTAAVEKKQAREVEGTQQHQELPQVGPARVSLMTHDAEAH